MVPIAIGAGAIVLGGIAIGLEISAHHTYDAAKLEADDTKQASLWHSANTKQYIAQGLGVAALGAAGVAVWLFVRGGSPETSGIALAPLVSSDQIGLAIGGRY
jgi:hypothetical protein